MKACCLGLVAVWMLLEVAFAADLERIAVSSDKTSFVGAVSGKPFVIWGVNYDHDSNGDGRLLEEYWHDEWDAVVEDFDEMRALGVNCVRIHLQFGLFMDTPKQANSKSLDQLGRLVALAEEKRLYLDITGLACYHRQHVPKWYDALSEEDRWGAQAVFWEAVAKVCAPSPAIFCYDLMNEPIVAGEEPADEWLTGELGGKYFVQRIALERKGRTPRAIAKAWIDRMAAAIRKHDEEHLITVGVIPWVFAFGGGKPLFHDPEVGAALDFVAVHYYPETGKIEKALESLKAYEVGKPLVIEEMFPLKCDAASLLQFIERSRTHVDGWISFYWGATPEQLRAKPEPSLAHGITAAWLEEFSGASPSRE